MTDIADCQPELNLRTRAAQCTVNAESVHELCGLLRGRGWVTCAELRRLRPEWTERFIRALAEESNAEKGKVRIVSGPGTPGYRLASEIDAAEMEHAGRCNLSQGRKMSGRGIKFLRAAKDMRALDAALCAESSTQLLATTETQTPGPSAHS